MSLWLALATVTDGGGRYVATLSVTDKVQLVVAGATLALAAVTGWMAWKTKQVADATQRSSEAIEREAKAVEREASQVAEQVEVQRRIAQASQQPWLKFVAGSFGVQPFDDFTSVSFQIENAGPGIALVVPRSVIMSSGPDADRFEGVAYGGVLEHGAVTSIEIRVFGTKEEFEWYARGWIDGLRGTLHVQLDTTDLRGAQIMRTRFTFTTDGRLEHYEWGCERVAYFDDLEATVPAALVVLKPGDTENVFRVHREALEPIVGVLTTARDRIGVWRHELNPQRIPSMENVTSMFGEFRQAYEQVKGQVTDPRVRGALRALHGPELVGRWSDAVREYGSHGAGNQLAELEGKIDTALHCISRFVKL